MRKKASIFNVSHFGEFRAKLFLIPSKRLPVHSIGFRNSIDKLSLRQQISHQVAPNILKMTDFGLILEQPQIPQQVNNLFMGIFCSSAGKLIIENCIYCLQLVDRIVLVNELLNTALYLCESVQHVLQ
jgi:hypothetical protein